MYFRRVGSLVYVGRRRRHIFAFLVLFGAAYSIGTLFWRSQTGETSSEYLRVRVLHGQQGAAKTNKPNLANEPACKLPSLDPEHPLVMEYIKDIGPLVCKGTTFSSFEKDVVRVKGDGIASVKYWTIVRTEGDDFNSELVGPTKVSNAFTGKKKKLKTNLDDLKPGQFGCIQHKVSGSCFHPRGGGEKPSSGTQVVFHSDCCKNRIRFLMEETGSLRHIPSDLCLKAESNKAKSKIIFDSVCDIFDTIDGGAVQHRDTKLCLIPLDRSVQNDGAVGLGDCSGEKHALQFKLSAPTGYFEANVIVKSDFVRVDVETRDGLQSDLHMYVQPKEEVLQRTVTPLELPLNVILIMFDSTSAAQFWRKMKETTAFLKKDLTTVFLKGHTVVGDGTTAQLAGMLTGIAEEEQPEARRSMPNSKTCDKWRFLFKDFKKNGYATFFSEDSPGTGTFTYRLKGFNVPPTDHYGRPAWFEGDKLASGYCTGTQATHRIQLKYLHSMLRAYKNPKFAFTLLSDLTHSNENTLGYADEDLRNLLLSLKKEALTENSMIIIFGDHGFRFSSIRNTFQGKLEERLPHMSISLPSWFPRKHPNLFDSLKNNSNLLTTPFDMYATMKHILSYPKEPDGIITGQSLFTPIDPAKRACSNNGVEDHWCPCLNWHELSASDSIVKDIVDFVIKHMNGLVAANSVASKLCARLTLMKIQSAQQQQPNQKLQTFLHSERDGRCDSCGVVTGEKAVNTLKKDALYQVQFTTSPNNGLYEVSVKLSKGKHSLAGDISRVNRYGSQPDCIKETYTHLVKFCLCRQPE